MFFRVPWVQEGTFWTFQKSIFKFFANVWVTMLKPFSAKVRQSLQNLLSQNLVIGNLLEKCFEGILSSETNVLRVWKEHSSVSCRFLSHEVINAFCESEGNGSKLIKSKFGYPRLLRKLFWRYLKLKNKCSERLKRPFFSFL